MRRSTASLPDCIGTCACLAIRGDSAIKPMNESLQSMGSTEEMRSFLRDVWSRTARTRSSSLGGREPRSTPPRAGPSHTWKSRPHRPKLIPEMTTSRYPASTNWFICPNTSSGLRERLRPRTEGIMQKEQRLLHPSCTFKLGRVRSLAESKTGAASSSVCAKISETKISETESGKKTDSPEPCTSPAAAFKLEIGIKEPPLPPSLSEVAPSAICAKLCL